MHKGGDVTAFFVVQQIGGCEVEVGGPEGEGFGKVGDYHAEVAEFVDFGRACLGGRRGGALDAGSIWDAGFVCGRGLTFLHALEFIHRAMLLRRLQEKGVHGQSSTLWCQSHVWERAPTKLNSLCSCCSSISLCACP